VNDRLESQIAETVHDNRGDEKLGHRSKYMYVYIKSVSLVDSFPSGQKTTLF